MKKFVFIPDSFKGTLSSKEICSIMDQKVKEEFLELQRTIREDRAYQMLIREYELIGRKLSGQMA